MQIGVGWMPHAEGPRHPALQRRLPRPLARVAMSLIVLHVLLVVLGTVIGVAATVCWHERRGHYGAVHPPEPDGGLKVPAQEAQIIPIRRACEGPTPQGVDRRQQWCMAAANDLGG